MNYSEVHRKNDFMVSVYDWLMLPMNKPILDYHEAIIALSKKKALQEIIPFWKQRFQSMYPSSPIKEEEEKLFKSCAIEYIKGFE